MKKRKFKVGDAVVLKSGVALCTFPCSGYKKLDDAIKHATKVRYFADISWYDNFRYLNTSNHCLKKDDIGIVTSVENVFMAHSYTDCRTINELIKDGVKRDDIITHKGFNTRYVNQPQFECYVVFINNTFVAFPYGNKLVKVENKEQCYGSVNVCFDIKLEVKRKNIDDVRLQKMILEKKKSLEKTMNDVSISSVSVVFCDGTASTLECDSDGTLKQKMIDVMPQYLRNNAVDGD
jgi:hypothetical protein